MSMKGESQWLVSDEETLELFIAHVRALYAQHRYTNYKWSHGDKRTRAQNNAMWLWLQLIAEALNDAGYDMRKTLKPHVEIPWNKERAKEHLWNPIQLAMVEKESSTLLTKEEFTEIQAVIGRHLAESTGVAIPFPTK